MRGLAAIGSMPVRLNYNDMTIRIHVTREILKQAANCSRESITTEEQFENKEGTGFNCAVALAVRDLLPMAFVSRYQIYFPKNAKEFLEETIMDYADLPLLATDFINAFDALPHSLRSGMEPISFTIEIPEAVIERIGITEIERILSESKTLEKV